MLTRHEWANSASGAWRWTFHWYRRHNTYSVHRDWPGWIRDSRRCGWSVRSPGGGIWSDEQVGEDANAGSNRPYHL